MLNFAKITVINIDGKRVKYNVKEGNKKRREKEITIMMNYLRLFVRTLYITAGVGIVAALIYGGIQIAFGHSVYSSTASILINEDVNSPYIEWNEEKDEYQNGNGVVTDTNYVTNLVNAALQLINTKIYQEVAIEELSDEIPNIEGYDFDTNITTGTYSNSSIVTVTAVYEDNSQYPADIANALCQAYKKETAEKLNADYNIIYSEATPSDKPENISIVSGMVLAGGGAFILAFALIMIIDALARSEDNELSWKITKRKKLDKAVAFDKIEESSNNEKVSGPTNLRM